MGMAIQLCEEEDHKIVEDLRGSLFGPLEFSRRDLMALNIQRGRDHGVPDYNSARRAYGLHEVKNVSHFNASPEVCCTKQQSLIYYNSSVIKDTSLALCLRLRTSSSDYITIHLTMWTSG